MEERRRDILHVVVVSVESYIGGRSKPRPYDGRNFISDLRIETSNGRATA